MLSHRWVTAGTSQTLGLVGSEREERWVTIGKDSHERVLVLIHTFSKLAVEECTIRIISARKANKTETRQYEEIKS